MKNLVGTFFIIGVTACAVVFWASCSEYGGTIAVTNNYIEDKTVTVYTEVSTMVIVMSYKDKYGPIDIPAGETGHINVPSNTTYWVFWKLSDDTDKYKTVDVANGDTAHIAIP